MRPTLIHNANRDRFQFPHPTYLDHSGDVPTNVLGFAAKEPSVTSLAALGRRLAYAKTELVESRLVEPSATKEEAFFKTLVGVAYVPPSYEAGIAGENESFPVPQRTEEAYWRTILHDHPGGVPELEDDHGDWLFQQYQRQLKVYFRPMIPTRGPEATIAVNGYGSLHELRRLKCPFMNFDYGKSC